MANKLILLVEDDPDDEELTLDALKHGGVQTDIIVVHDGAEALDYIFPNSGGNQRRLPNLILLDLKLPKISGLEVLRQVRRNDVSRRIPTVILTSSSEHSDIHQSYELGANSYVRKPVQFAAFARAVQTLGAYWILFNQTPPEHL